MTIIEINKQPKAWLFVDILGNEYEANVPAGKDPEAACCDAAHHFQIPMRCVPKLVTTSSGLDRGEIII